MSKFIDADKFREMMDYEYPFDKYTQTHYPALDAAKSAVLKVLNICPAAEVEPIRHAHWVIEECTNSIDGSIYKRYRCSECSCPTAMFIRSPYCSNCGAKMVK